MWPSRANGNMEPELSLTMNSDVTVKSPTYRGKQDCNGVYIAYTVSLSICDLLPCSFVLIEMIQNFRQSYVQTHHQASNSSRSQYIHATHLIIAMSPRQHLKTSNSGPTRWRNIVFHAMYITLATCVSRWTRIVMVCYLHPHPHQQPLTIILKYPLPMSFSIRCIDSTGLSQYSNSCITTDPPPNMDEQQSMIFQIHARTGNSKRSGFSAPLRCLSCIYFVP